MRILLIAAMLLSASVAVADKKPEPVNCVRLAKTWDAALEEAKICNVPIIVHSHGFT